MIVSYTFIIKLALYLQKREANGKSFQRLWPRFHIMLKMTYVFKLIYNHNGYSFSSPYICLANSSCHLPGVTTSNFSDAKPAELLFKLSPTQVDLSWQINEICQDIQPLLTLEGR